MLSDIEDSHGPSDTMHNPSQPLKVGKTLFQNSRRFTHFYQLSHSELVDIEKVALSSSLRSLKSKCTIDEIVTHWFTLIVLSALRRSAGNHVKEILLKFNLPDHMSILTDSKIEALVDKKKVIITETSIRRDLQLANENGTDCLPNATIFAELERMGAKTTVWNEFSSTMASVIICLATNQRFNFSNYIFDNMVKNVEGEVKFLMYPRQEKDLSGRYTPLFQTMMVQAQEEGEGSVMPTVPQHTHTINPPSSSSQPLKKQKPRKPLKLEIAKLKERVKKLERRNKSRTPGLKRIRKVGRTARIESSEDEGLGDASKQGRKIVDIDADEEVTLIDETQGRTDDNLMFDIGVLDEQEGEVEKIVSTTEVTTASATTTTVDELTLAQTLIEIKAAKPKAVTTAATTTTTAVTRPKARGVLVQEPKELQAELEKEERLARQKEEDANIAKWDNFQAMIDADYELAARLQAQEQKELTIEERYKQNQLKSKNYDEIQKLFDKSMTRVNIFVDMDTNLVKGSSKKAEMVQESSSKRAGEELESDNSKKQK
ncbi:hypothetical protein Tco_1562170 [Tanacetum coccineum]